VRKKTFLLRDIIYDNAQTLREFSIGPNV